MLFGMIPIGALLLTATMVFVVFLLVKLVWAWTIPDLFPGAVEQGLVAREISWYTAFKLAIFVGVVSSFMRGRRE
jgi:hypothetical protein